jgi:hypothetical protein
MTKYKSATLISNSKKFKTTQNVIQNIDFVVDIIKIDVENILQKKQIFTIIISMIILVKL